MQMDVRDMSTFQSGSFDVVFDKGDFSPHFFFAIALANRFEMKSHSDFLYFLLVLQELLTLCL